ncbi:MAG: DUF6677 family protein [Planctomycetales bacterium]
MPSSRIPLKNPILAALLAFLVPGLGHFYQRRVFKGVLYSVCILGTFFTGLRIGHGQVVYFDWQNSENRTYAYLCQFWVGIPALPALYQAKMRSPRDFDANYVPRHFQAYFEGSLSNENEPLGQIAGRISLQPQQPDMPHTWSGKLEGTLTTDQETVKIEGELTPGDLEAQVAPSSKRLLKGNFKGRLEGRPNDVVRGTLEGHIPRSIRDSYGAPLRDSPANDLGDQTDLNRSHFELGSRFELGVVFTMIAGLLNILAIYDALEGPAYEGDEPEEPEENPPTPKTG